MRTLRALAVGHRLGAGAARGGPGGGGAPAGARLVQHARTTATHLVSEGGGTTSSDVRGPRGATKPSSTRGPAPSAASAPARATRVHHVVAAAWRGRCWASPQQLEFLATVSAAELAGEGGEACCRGVHAARGVASACDCTSRTRRPTGVAVLGLGRARPARPRRPPRRSGRFPSTDFEAGGPVRPRRSPRRGCCAWGTTCGGRDTARARRYWLAGPDGDARAHGAALPVRGGEPRGCCCIRLPPATAGPRAARRRVPCGESSLWGGLPPAGGGACTCSGVVRRDPYLVFWNGIGTKFNFCHLDQRWQKLKFVPIQWTELMTTIDLHNVQGRRYPPAAVTKNVVGGASPIQAEHFCLDGGARPGRRPGCPGTTRTRRRSTWVLEGRGNVPRRGAGDAVGGQACHPAARVPPDHQRRPRPAAPRLRVRAVGRRGALAAGAGRHAAARRRDAPPLPEGARPQLA